MKREKGFSILELIAVIAAGGILIAASVGVYQKFERIHRRQQGLMLVEEELNAVQVSLGQLLTTMPGRELGYFNGEDFSVPELPFGGSALTENGAEQFKLGVVTPLKINGNDAISVVYALRDAPRLELIEQSLDASDKGIARAATPGISRPEELNLKAGDLMMLAGPGTSKSGGNAGSAARLVRLLAEPVLVNRGFPRRDAFEFSFDFCGNGACSDKLPSLINSTSQKIFTAGSALVPVNVSTVYLAKEGSRSRVMRCDGGSLKITANGLGIEGGVCGSLGESDSLKFSYLLDDGTEQPAPESPAVDWLNRIKAVNAQLSKSMKLSTGETAGRTVAESFPITIKCLD